MSIKGAVLRDFSEGENEGWAQEKLLSRASCQEVPRNIYLWPAANFGIVPGNVFISLQRGVSQHINLIFLFLIRFFIFIIIIVLQAAHKSESAECGWVLVFSVLFLGPNCTLPNCKCDLCGRGISWQPVNTSFKLKYLAAFGVKREHSAVKSKDRA